MLKLIIYVSFLFAFTLISLQSSFAEINSVEMKVDGLTCPFCVFGVEKKLKALDEIEGVNTNLKSGFVEVFLKDGKAIDINRLNNAVKESGFTPGDIKVTATGEFTESSGNPAIKVSGSDQIFLLVGSKSHEKEEFLSEERIAEINTATESGGKKLTVNGYLHTHSELPSALSLESYEIK